MWRLLSLALAVLLTVGSAVHAADYIPDTLKKSEQHTGWDGLLTLGATLSLNSNSNVIGQVDGAATTAGVKLDSGLYYRRAAHEWRSTLSYSGNTSRTPALPRFIKTADQLLLESIYLYKLRSVSWLGPFGRLMLDTPVFKGHDQRAESVTYLVTRLDGSTYNAVRSRFRLSGPFSPLTLKQSLGAFAKPIDKKTISVEARVGFGGMEIVSEGSFAQADDKATPQIELFALDNTLQAGAEISIAASGKLAKNRVTYSTGLDVLIPFINNKKAGDDRGVAELTNLEFFAKVSFKLFSWASLDYEFRAVRKPQLLDELQIQNNLLLTFSYALIERAKPVKAK